MLRVGLTGGIGSGKSSAARRFGALGAVVIDADVLAREVVAPGSEGLAAVVERFGEQVLAPDGALDRAALGAVVFADAGERAALEAITHPRIAARTAERVASAPPDSIVVHDVPLLVEKHMGAAYHLAVVVGAGEEVRVARLTGSRGMSEEDARARIRAQADDAARRAAADVWLDNDGPPELLAEQVRALWSGRLVPFNDNLTRMQRARRSEVPTIVAPDPAWPEQAVRLSARIQRALGGRAVSIQHIGSTSVPGLAAKDVLDLQVGVTSLAVADDDGFVAAMEAAAFPRSTGNVTDTPMAELPDPARWHKRFHGTCDPGRVAHIHVREVRGPGWRFALLFRDWLRAQPAERAAYQAHKIALAAEQVTSTAYAQAKDPWFARAAPRAEEWARATGWSATG